MEERKTWQKPWEVSEGAVGGEEVVPGKTIQGIMNSLYPNEAGKVLKGCLHFKSRIRLPPSACPLPIFKCRN